MTSPDDTDSNAALSPMALDLFETPVEGEGAEGEKAETQPAGSVVDTELVTESSEPPIARIYMVYVDASSTAHAKVLSDFEVAGGFREEWGQDWRPWVAASEEEAKAAAFEVVPRAQKEEAAP
jgi:hypothetical protein